MRQGNTLNLKNRLSDNRGVAMVSVMIVLTVCMLIATIVLQITYTSLLSRRVNSQASSNFYAAEGTLDDVQSVLQSIAVYSTNVLASNSSMEFVDVAHDVLYENAGADASLSVEEQNAKISEYLFNNLQDEYKQILGQKQTDETGATVYVYDSTKFKVSAVTKKDSVGGAEKGSLTISVELNYEDEKGYLTSISTDLVLNDVVKRKSASNYALGSYSMFTGGGVEFKGNDISANQRPVFVQEGNCYIGTMASEAPKAMGITKSAVYLTGAAIVNGDIYIQDHSTLNFTAGSDESGSRTEITIRGTIYIDSTSALVISDEVDFLCEDIIITDGTNEYSVFDGEKSYIAYSGSFPHSKHFPFSATTIKGLENADKTVNGTVYSDFEDGSTGGCVLISTGDEAYVAQRTGSDWYLLKGENKTKSGALINQSEICVPQAKATIWTYDGKQVTMDAEMVNFVNAQLLNFQGTIAPNTGLHAHSAQLIAHDASSTVSKGSIDTDFGGAPVTGVSKFNFGDTTTALISSGKMVSSVTDKTLGLTFADMGLSSIVLGDNTLDGVTFKIGKITDCGENLDSDNSRVVIVCVWEDYIIQQNGGTVVGIVMSADKCKYDVNGRMVTTACSVLNAKDDGTNNAKTQMDNLFKELQFVSFSRTSNNSTQYYANGVNFYDDYQLTLLDSLFVGGMTSFTSDGGGQQGGDAYIDTSNMYDFITIENWQANK